MNLRRIDLDLVQILSTVAGMLWLFVHGWLLPGFVLAGVLLALMAHRYGSQSPRPPMSKEEELAAWGLKWELDNPASMNKPTSVPKPEAFPRLRGGMP